MVYKLLELRTYMIDENCGVFEMLQEIPAKEEFEENGFNCGSKEVCKDLIIDKIKFEYDMVEKDKNPQIKFILFGDNEPIGICGLRTKLDDFWKIHGGNISCITRPKMRGKGYGVLMVGLLCEKAKQLGLEEVFAQCNKRNIASLKVLLKNNFVQYDPKMEGWSDTCFLKKTLI